MLTIANSPLRLWHQVVGFDEVECLCRVSSEQPSGERRTFGAPPFALRLIQGAPLGVDTGSEVDLDDSGTRSGVKRPRRALTPNEVAGEALCLAASRGDLESLTRLLAHGADINYTYTDPRTAIRRTPLQAACDAQKAEVVFIILYAARRAVPFTDHEKIMGNIQGKEKKFMDRCLDVIDDTSHLLEMETETARVDGLVKAASRDDWLDVSRAGCGSGRAAAVWLI